MQLFKRRAKASDTLPDEIKDYYATEQRERVGVAWLLAFLSLVVTMAVVIGLFFGARWTYRKIANRGGADITIQAPAEPDTAQTPGPNSEESSVAETEAPTGTSAPDTSGRPSDTQESASAQLSETGPGSTLAIFIAVTALSATIHNLAIRRSTKTS